jgi:hypothetical protein
MSTKRKTAPPPTDAEMFTMVGQALFPVDDWPSRFGAVLGLPKQTVRDIRREHADLLPEVAAIMLPMIERHAVEAVRARDALKVWLKKRGP